MLFGTKLVETKANKKRKNTCCEKNKVRTRKARNLQSGLRLESIALERNTKNTILKTTGAYVNASCALKLSPRSKQDTTCPFKLTQAIEPTNRRVAIFVSIWICARQITRLRLSAYFVPDMVGSILLLSKARACFRRLRFLNSARRFPMHASRWGCQQSGYSPCAPAASDIRANKYH